MSQSTVSQEQSPQDAQSPQAITEYESAGSSPRGEFDYRPVPILAPVSFFFGVCSLLALLWEFGVVIGLFGILSSLVCLLIIRRANGELGGKLLCRIGLVMSSVLFVAGLYFHVNNYLTEVPEGFQRVHFNSEISKKGFVFDIGTRKLHPDVAKLEGQKIFVKGFMWNTTMSTGLDQFLLLKDNGQCCFGGDPKPTDMIWVEMQNQKVDAHDTMVAVAGVLRCDPNAAEGKPVYVLEATLLELARTSH